MPAREVPQNPPGTPGLKRHAALIALSRDHHHALRHALFLRRAARADTADDAARGAARDFLDFYEREMRGHFSDEEELLLPRAGACDPAGAARILAEHAELSGLVSRLQGALASGAGERPVMHRIGQLIDDHVRHEERAFFMRVQERLAPDELEQLARALDERRAARGAAPGCPLPRR